MTKKFAPAIFTFGVLGFLSSACDHECSCTPKGTWAGATTTSSGGYSSVTSVCKSTPDITDPKTRRTDCFYVCSDRLASEGVTSDYDKSFGPAAVACIKDCTDNAKLSVDCVEGKRVSTFGAWN